MNVSIVARTVPNAVVIPVVALLKTPEGEATVMVAGADGRAHQQAVETGIRHQDEVQITKGLKGGDTVVTAGGYGLPDNTKIRTAPATPVNQPSKPSPGKE